MKTVEGVNIYFGTLIALLIVITIFTAKTCFFNTARNNADLRNEQIRQEQVHIARAFQYNLKVGAKFDVLAHSADVMSIYVVESNLSVTKYKVWMHIWEMNNTYVTVRNKDTVIVAIWNDI